MEAVGTAAAIVGVIDVVARSILKLAEIRERYRTISLMFDLLYGRLTTVKAALEQINELINNALGDEQQHYQLVMNLDVAIECCYRLVQLVDERLSNLTYDDFNLTTRTNKLRLALEIKTVDECMIRLDHQVNALTLVITAFQCRNTMQQHSLLTSQNAQRVFQTVKDDTTSLRVLCDDQSFQTRRTQTTTTTSKLSMTFGFDDEILQHKAYKNTFKSLMRRVGTGSGRVQRLINQLASPDEDRLTKTLLESDSLAEMTRRRYDEVRVLAIVNEDDELLYTLQKMGGFIVEEKKRIARERMIRWAMMQMESAFRESRILREDTALHCSHKCLANLVTLQRGLHDLHSRPAYVLDQSIEAAQWFLSRIDEDRFAALRRGDISILQLVRRFLEPRFEPSEEDISSFDNSPDVGTYEVIDCIILNLDLMEFDGLADKDSIRLKCGILRYGLLRKGLPSISHTLLLLKNKARFAERLNSAHPNDSFSGSRGFQRAMDFSPKSITGRDSSYSFADWDVDQLDMDLKPLYHNLVGTLIKIAVARQFEVLFYEPRNVIIRT